VRKLNSLKPSSPQSSRPPEFGLGLFAIAISLITFALLLLVFAAVFALALVVPLWAAALISAGVVFAPCDGGSAGGSRRDVSREEPEA